MTTRTATARITGADYEVREPNSEQNQALLARIDSVFWTHDGPRVGDYALLPDGRTMRVSHHWGDALQLSEGGSWYIGTSGFASFSGGLEPGIAIERFVLTNEIKPGRFWFFDRDWRRAHAAVYALIDCRVYRVRGDK